MSDGITFTCALRSGASYHADDVRRLGRAIGRNSSPSKPVEFRPLTDVDGCGEPLLHDWPGWWSLIECFRIPGPAMFVGLDTVIVDTLDPLHEFILDLPNDEFAMIRPFNKDRAHGQWASGITCWNGDWSWIYEEFKQNASFNMDHFGMEQKFTCDALQKKSVKVHEIQDHISGIYSFKHDCYGSLPKDARIVLFHGEPRLPEMACVVPWVKEHWR